MHRARAGAAKGPGAGAAGGASWPPAPAAQDLPRPHAATLHGPTGRAHAERYSAGMNDAAPILSFHAHVYYDPAATRGTAEVLRQRIGERFRVQLGRWHDLPVGPHTAAMYQVAFAPEVFADFVPWLMLERSGLTVLLHPNTLAPRDDHLVHALWLGAPLALKEEALPLRIAAADESAVVPNTTPRLAVWS